MDAGAWQRIVIGGLGGLAAIFTKYIAQDHNLIDQWSSLDDPRLVKMMIGYAILTPMLVFLGALLAWVSQETQPMKLLAMGIAAPALITTMAGGSKLPSTPPQIPGRASIHLEFSPISTAFAGDRIVQTAQAGAIKEGVELFFGVGKEQRYWVIVGSFRNRDEAEAKAEQINRQNRALKAFVGKRQPNNEFYPVIVGDYVPLAEANRIREAASRLPGVEEAYLSAFADRRQ